MKYRKIWLYLLAVQHLAFGFVMANTLENVSTRENVSTSKIPSIKYRLQNLGQSSLENGSLALSPAINDARLIIGNHTTGGFLLKPEGGEWSPYTNDIKINFHALNNCGDILVSLNRKANETEWMIWSTKEGEQASKLPIKVKSFKDAYFIGLTDKRIVIGNATISNKITPIVWEQETGIQSLAELSKRVLSGKAIGINNEGTLIARINDDKGSPPALWSTSEGLKVMQNFRTRVSPQSHVDLLDLLVADDGTVYGSYKVDEKGEKSDTVYTYAWEAFSGKLTQLALDGMRMMAINHLHTLVGTLEGGAAICEAGKKPQLLCDMVRKNDMHGWQLLEATGINKFGDIVGNGLYNGHKHIFLLQKEELPRQAELTAVSIQDLSCQVPLQRL